MNLKFLQSINHVNSIVSSLFSERVLMTKFLLALFARKIERMQWLVVAINKVYTDTI